METWNTAQSWEGDWWSDCTNTLNEEIKQTVYAQKMGLNFTRDPKTPYNIDLQDKTVIDIGSGPVSILLKCKNFKRATAVDPLMNTFPNWVRLRYKEVNIETVRSPGEDLTPEFIKEVTNIYYPFDFKKYDIALIYNVLQHTINPEKIVKNALKIANEVRIFEWIDTSVNVGHPHSLKEDQLNKWLGGEGKVEVLNERGCYGKAYFGIFPSKYATSSS